MEKNLKAKYYQRLRYENKFLENKERLMTIYKMEDNDKNSDMVSVLFYYLFLFSMQLDILIVNFKL